MTPNDRPATAGFIALMALMTSLVAMSTDVMLPALDIIGRDLSVPRLNDTQLVVSVFFFGLAAGQVVVGPLSDRFGRRPVVFAGYGLFLAGCVLSMLTTSWGLMLAGRALAGFGASAPRIVAVAIVRDRFEGRSMARVMSFVSAVFILVPVVAPAVGQGMVGLAGWRATFLALIVPGVAALAWFALAQPETLRAEDRRPFSLAAILGGIGEILRNRAALTYTLAMGPIFGVFISYLGTAQQVFGTTFGTGALFPAWFALAAVSIGAASLVNARLVMGLGMRRLTIWALLAMTLFSIVFLAPVLVTDGVPPFWLFMTWLMAVFFCVGIVFANLNALAMEPLGHMAGLGAAFVGALSTFLSLPLAWFIGGLYDGTVIPLVAGFAAMSAATLALTARAARAD